MAKLIFKVVSTQFENCSL